MLPWRWRNLEVLEEWGTTHDRWEYEVIRTAIEDAANSDPGYAPGEQVEPYSGPYIRVIRTPVANIYFTTYGYAWNSSHDTLHLLDIRSTTGT